MESHLGADSQIFQYLTDCYTSYGWLTDKLGAVEPTLENLNASVKVMLDSESKLAQQFDDFGKKLEQAQASSKGNPELEKQLADKFSENTQLQLGLQKMASEVDSLKQLASEKDATIQKMQQSLSDARERFRAAEARNQGLEIEKTALKGEMELRDQRFRHELATEHTSSQNQMNAQYEQQLRTLQAEKNDLEKSAEQVMTQLSGVQGALVGHATALIAGTPLTASRVKRND
jgi:predicted  nucleic acid-binding Zn-ribbon protein